MTSQSLPFSVRPAQDDAQSSELANRYFNLQVEIWERECDQAMLRTALRKLRLARARLGREYYRSNRGGSHGIAI